MSINWVMLSPSASTPFTPLPNEQKVFSSSPRVAFSLSTPAHFPGKQQQAFSLSASSGVLHLTNRRLIFLPDKISDKLQSFAAPILNLHDSHVTAPWFGPNDWMALLQPTQGGGIPTPPTGVVTVKFTFKEGGAFDFHSHYERIRERLQQAVDVSRIDGDGSGSSRAAMNGIDITNVNMDELPAYQERGDGPLIPPVAPAALPGQSSSTHQQRDSQDSGLDAEPDRTRRKPRDCTPAEPPPGYEEAQLAGLRDEFERTSNEDQR